MGQSSGQGSNRLTAQTASTYPEIFRSDIITPVPAEHLPVYPGAHEEIVGALGSAYWGDTYRVNAQVSEITDFYKVQLPKSGWALQWEKSVGGYYLAYSWLDPQNTTPYDLSLGIYVVNAYASNLNTTEVTLSLYRVPNLSKVTSQPGAEQISIFYDQTWSTTPPATEAINRDINYDRTVTYLVDTSAAQVLDYYRAKLKDYGWQFGGPSYPDGVHVDPSSLLFYYHFGGVDSGNVRNCSFVVRATDAHPGQAKVTIRIEGRTDLRQ